MKSEPTVSVVMPVWNAVESVGSAVSSVATQSLQDWELIIVDDGSDDGSAEVLDGWAQQDERIRVLRQEHRGIVEALNAGMAAARGRFIARTDADDILLPHRLEKQANRLVGHAGVGVVSCLVEYMGDREANRGFAAYVDWSNSLVSAGDIRLHRFVESPVVHPTVMFRREVMQAYGAYRSGGFPEDYELWLRWLEAGVEMEKLPDVLMEWHDSEGRLSRGDARYSAEAFYQIKSEYLARWLAQSNPYHPNVTIWGAGREARRRAELLVEKGIRIAAYVDIDPKKVGHRIKGRPVLSPSEMPKPCSHFVLPYVGSRGARDAIDQWLKTCGYRSPRDYIFAA